MGHNDARWRGSVTQDPAPYTKTISDHEIKGTWREIASDNFALLSFYNRLF